MKVQEDLLNKYFSAKTNAEEETKLQEALLADEESAERDMMEYFSLMRRIPDNLENEIFDSVMLNNDKGRSIRMNIYRIASVAAMLAVVVTAYLGFRAAENKRIEKEFLVIEQALLQVSKSIEPQEQEEMIVLWVDNDVEIIIN